ncbi:MAG TPA: 4Fe-4S dicluster domain-containing protein [Candidatus Sulfomarinibacteraceae bacterium]|nr:4Fe-4S dicluster domain-containing protein [Candidatus Sulfomarinibacteraceae bacterium]
MASIPSPIHPDNLRAVRRIAEISGQNVYECMQCGTCSAVCPMVESMGFTTRQGIHYLQFGEVEAVIDARIGEFCASCHTCVVRCPRGIDVPRVFEAVRQLVLRTNKDLVTLRDIPEETLAEAPQIAFVSTFRKLTS